MWLSMVLTSQAHRCCTPKKNRRIPTIPTGCFDAGIVHVSAVDTGPRGSESGLLTAESGISVTGPSPPRPLPAACAGSRWSWFDAGSAPSWPESVYSRVGIYWPRVVRTARRPHLPEVPPTLVQWHPTVVQWQCIQTTPAATTVTGSAPLRQAQAAALPSGRPIPPMS